MSMEELNKQLAQGTQAKQNLILRETRNLLSVSETLKKEFGDVATTFAADMRTEVSTTRQNLATEAEKTRTTLVTLTTDTRRRLLKMCLWAVAGGVGLASVTVVATLFLTQYIVRESTGQVLSQQQTQQTKELADTLTKVAQAKAELAATEAKAKELAGEIMREARLTTFSDTEDPTILYVQVPPMAKTWVWKNKTLIQAQTRNP